MNEVGEFLKANGFATASESVYVNGKCNVIFNTTYYEIIDREGNAMYTESISIYALIGILTYCGFMDKNYKQLN